MAVKIAIHPTVSIAVSQAIQGMNSFCDLITGNLIHSSESLWTISSSWQHDCEVRGKTSSKRMKTIIRSHKVLWYRCRIWCTNNLSFQCVDLYLFLMISVLVLAHFLLWIAGTIRRLHRDMLTNSSVDANSPIMYLLSLSMAISFSQERPRASVACGLFQPYRDKQKRPFRPKYQTRPKSKERHLQDKYMGIPSVPMPRPSPVDWFAGPPIHLKWWANKP